MALLMLDSLDASARPVSNYSYHAYAFLREAGYRFAYGAEIGMLFELLRDSEMFFAEDTAHVRAIRAHPASVRFELQLREDEQAVFLQPVLLQHGESLLFNKDTRTLSSQPTWLIRGAELLRVEGNPPAKFLLSLQSWNQPEIRVPKSDVGEFFAEIGYIPGLASHLAIPNQNAALLVENFASKRLCLSEGPEELLIRLVFDYGGHEVDCAPPELSSEMGEVLVHQGEGLQFARIRRDHRAEAEAREVVLATGLRQASTGEFVLRENRSLDWLLLEAPKLIAQGFEIFGEENLKRHRVNRATPKMNLAVSSAIDWFDCRLAIDFNGIALSLKELRKSLTHRSRYVKLDDGSTGLLPEEWQEQLSYLFNLGEASAGEIKVSRHHITLIDMLFEEAQIKQADREYYENLQRLRNFAGIEPIALPEGFQGSLRPYQNRGLDWLYFLQEFRFGGCLADDMGLGKTIQTLALLQKEKERGVTTPSLIICPTSVLFNWEKEIQRFTPGLRAHMHTGAARRRSQDFEDTDVVLTSYGILRRDIEFLKDAQFHYLILDESQHIKNPDSQTAKAARLLKGSHRLVLTGTPVENNTQELWSQFNFLNPGLLGSLNYFREAFGRPIERSRDGVAGGTLRKLIFPFILRRTKGEVESQLPEKLENLFYCTMLKEQRKLYDRWRDYYRAHVMQQIDLKGLEKSRMYVLEGLTRLRQICCHPHLVDQQVPPESGKFEAFQEMLQEILAENHKVLVFSQFVRMLRLICRYFDEQKIPYTYLDGHTKDRQTPVEQFQSDPNTRVFLISLKAGGFGLNLTAADYVILYDPWWNPAAEMQAVDRAHRIGQDKRVFAYKMIVRDSVEEKILQLQERKKELVANLIATDSGLFKHLTKADIEGLFS
jgi:non-specific serine/threonine protein kinase